MFYLSKIARTYYCRIRVPKDVSPYFPLREIKKSLGTCRYKEARQLITIFSAKAERIFTLIRTGVMTDDQIRNIVDEFLDTGVRLFESQRNGEITFKDNDRQRFIVDHNNRLDRMIETDEGLALALEARKLITEDAKKQLVRKKGTEYPFISDFADSYLKRHCITLDKDSVEYNKLCNELLKANIRLDSIINEHLSGNYETDYDVESRTRKKYITLKQLIDLYEKDKKNSWADKVRLPSVHRQILHIIGDIPLNTIDRQTSITLRESLKEYPKKLNSNDMKIPWRELAKIRATRLAGRTQIFILTEYCTLIKYAKENDLGVKGSPAKGLVDKSKPVKKEKDRQPYTPEEIQRLVAVLKEVDREKEPEWFWLPLLLLHLGSRSNEICMLRCDDIEQRGPFWMVCFRNRPEYSQRTKNGKDRQAPLHQDLIELGFLDFVARQKTEGKDRLFSNLVFYRDKWNVYYGKDFNRTFKKKFLVDYSEAQLKEKDLHSFRKTMIAWFVQRKELMTLPNISILQSIVGHFEQLEISYILDFLQSSKLTLEDYGGGYGKEIEQNELLQKLDYGIDLSLLIQ